MERSMELASSEVVANILRQIAAIAVDFEGRVLFWTEGAERLYSVTAEQMIGHPASTCYRCEYLHGEDEQTILAKVRDVGSWSGESIHLLKDGRRLLVESDLSLLRDDEDHAVGIMLVVRDVTLRRRQQKDDAGRSESGVEFEAHQRLQALMKALPVGVSFSEDATCTSISGNPAVLAQFEVAPEENLSASALDAAAPGRQVRFFQKGRPVSENELPLQRAVAENREIPCTELDVVLPSGRRWMAEAYGAPVRDAMGNVVGGVAVTVDVTERRLANQKVHEAHQKLESVLSSIADGLAVIDRDWRISYFSQQGARMLGLSVDSLVGNNVWDVFPQAVGTKFYECFRRSMDSGQPAHLEEFYPEPLDKWIECDVHASADGLSVYFRDIGQRKAAETALRKSEARFRKLFESDLMGICIPDRFGAFYEGNDEFLRVVGYTREDLDAGRVRWDVMTPPEYAELDAAHIAEAGQRGSCTPYEKEYIRKDGSRVPIACGYALLEGSEDVYVGFIQDLSVQKQAEAGLREREERFRVLAESLPEFVWMRDGDGEYVYCNQRLLDYVGQPEEWLRTHAYEAVHPDDLAGTGEKWKRSLETGEIYLNEYRLRRHDGAYRHFLARAVPVRDEAGRIQRWLGSTTDVHDQKLAEEALRRTEKLNAAARLASSMAHEINNPLAAVVNALYLALQDKALTPETRSYLSLAEQELERAVQAATQMLRFHKQSTAPVAADLSEVMDALLVLYAPRLKSCSITVEREYLTHEKLHCFKDELRQVFANLITNSIDATQGGGQLRIRIAARRAPDDPSTYGIRVVVADTGEGIPRELQGRVFEPFVSTKEITGTGLGLWVTEGIIRKHKGRIALRSSTDAVRHGTAFSIFLPLDSTLEGRTVHPAEATTANAVLTLPPGS
jgi:PAS domain S-box-containing protein